MTAKMKNGFLFDVTEKSFRGAFFESSRVSPKMMKEIDKRIYSAKTMMGIRLSIGEINGGYPFPNNIFIGEYPDPPAVLPKKGKRKNDTRFTNPRQTNIMTLPFSKVFFFIDFSLMVGIWISLKPHYVISML